VYRLVVQIRVSHRLALPHEQNAEQVYRLVPWGWDDVVVYDFHTCHGFKYGS